MSNNRSHSLRAILTVLVLVSVTPSFLVAAWLVQRDYLARRDQIYHDAVMTAKGIVADLDREVIGVESGLKILATSSELAAGNFAAFHERATDALKPQGVANFLLLDLEGRQRVNTLRPWGAELPAKGAPPAVFEIVAAKKTMSTTDLFLGTLTQSPFLAVCVPVAIGGQVVYVLCASVLPERLNQMLARQALPSNWFSSVLDGTGTIVARSQDSARAIGRPAMPAVVAAVTSKADGTIETVNRDKVNVLLAFSRSKVSGWTATAAAPMETLVSDLRRSIALVAGAAALALVIGIGSALRLASRVGSSVRGLIGPALSIGSLNPIAPPSSSVKEVASLGDALVQASQRLIRAEHRAHHDALTGLSNRLLLEEIARQRIDAAIRAGSTIAVLAIDLDGFKAVNDVHGHAAGDKVLKIAAERITDGVRASDIRARIGGDEFVVLLENTSAAMAEVVAGKLLASLAQPYPGIQPALSASIGIALWPSSGRTLTELLARADQALYSAKRGGKRRLAFDPVH